MILLTLLSTGELPLVFFRARMLTVTRAESGYDLWEEVLGNSFFTVAASHRGQCHIIRQVFTS